MNLLQKIFISLGTNEGDRLQNLQKVIDVLYEELGNILAISPIYETSSWGFESEDFLNCCVGLTSSLSPEDLLIAFKRIEKSFGRKDKIGDSYQARVIDIDILFYENEIIDNESLQVPHIALTERRFVLEPLADIASNYNHPKLNTTIHELLASCTDISEVNLFPGKLDNPFDIHAFSKFSFIAIEGNIGSGKTTLAKMITQDFNAKLILERFADNAFLPKFYEDQSRFAFPLEMSFLADRYKQLSDDISQYDLFKEFVVADYHISKSLTFAKVTLPEDEFALYRKFFNVIYKEMHQPDVYVYLYQNTERLLSNIKMRGRDYEQNIESDYLEKINKGYLEFVKSQPNLNVKIIDVSELDFVEKRKDYIKVLKQILN